MASAFYSLSSSESVYAIFHGQKLRLSLVVRKESRRLK